MNNIFVRVVGNTIKGFSEGKSYQVCHIDVYDGDNQKITEFLLSDDNNEFHWVNSSMTKRVFKDYSQEENSFKKPQYQNRQQPTYKNKYIHKLPYKQVI